MGEEEEGKEGKEEGDRDDSHAPLLLYTVQTCARTMLRIVLCPNESAVPISVPRILPPITRLFLATQASEHRG